jgi:hypothetical protein
MSTSPSGAGVNSVEMNGRGSTFTVSRRFSATTARTTAVSSAVSVDFGAGICAARALLRAARQRTIRVCTFLIGANTHALSQVRDGFASWRAAKPRVIVPMTRR